MKPCFRVFRCALIAALLSAVVCHAAYKWPEWDRSELAETRGRVDPDAGAEVMLYTVDVDHGDIFHLTEEHYVRVKIFNASALEQFAKVEIPYLSSREITGVMVRTIKPDGTILELGRKDIVDREVIKADSARLRVKAFAPAGLEPGAVLEYRYVKEPIAFLTWVVIQREVPVRQFRCKVRPWGDPYLEMKSFVFRCPKGAAFVFDKKSGYSTFTHQNFTAVRDEPYSPPEIETKASIILIYRARGDGFGKEFWSETAKDLFKEGTRVTKRAKTVESAAASVVAASDTQEAKLRKLYDFCRTNIRNHESDRVVLTPEERRRLPTNRTPADTLKNRTGSREDINLLFAALAATTGVETRLAIVNDRSMMIATPANANDISMNDKVAAVKLDGEWVFCDPGRIFLPFGMLPWQHNDTCHLLAEPKGGEVGMRGGPGSEKSLRQRRADLVLDANGTLEGQVRISYTGLWEAEMKEELDGRTEEAREESLKEEITGYLPRAEITDMRFENVADPVAPLKVSYHMRVPGYAERMGSRLFMQPAVFEKGTKPRFTAKTREEAIIFKYRFTESDVVSVRLPEGYTTEVRAAPKPQSFGVLGSYDVQLGMGKDPGFLVYKRQFAFNAVGIPAKHYEVIRGVFELIHEQDGHLLTLRRADEEPAAAKPAESAPGE